MGMALGPSGHNKADINVTPLIDELLVLLIIFMTVAPVTPVGLQALVPQPPLQDQKVRRQDIVITVKADGTVLLNQEVVPAGELGDRLARIFKLRGDDVVFVRGEGEMEFRRVAGVIDVARGAGLSRVALMTTH